MIGLARSSNLDAHGKLSTVVLAISTAATAALVLIPKRMPTLAVAMIGTSAWLFLGVFVYLQHQRSTVTAPVVFAFIAAAFVAAVAMPSRGSDDVWSYAMYGRIVSHYHVSPWTHLPTSFQRDPYFARISVYWKAQGSVYGPAFVALASVVMWLTGTNALASRIAFQSIAGLAVLATLFLLHRRGVNPVAIACVGLNPLTAASIVNGAHNDAIAGLCVVAAVFCVIDRRSKLAGVLAALALGVKAIVFLPIGALLVWSWFNRSKRDTLVTTSVTAGVSFIMLIPAGITQAFGPLRGSSDLINTGSVWYSGFEWYRKQLMASGYARTLALADASSVVVAVATALMLTLAAVVVWNHRHDDDPIVAVGGASLSYFLLAAYVQPWYLAWVLPVLATKYRSIPALIGAAYSALIMLSLQYWWHPPHREHLVPSMLSQPYLGVFEVIGVIAMGTVVVRRRRLLPKKAAKPAIKLSKS